MNKQTNQKIICKACGKANIKDEVSPFTIYYKEKSGEVLSANCYIKEFRQVFKKVCEKCAKNGKKAKEF